MNKHFFYITTFLQEDDVYLVLLDEPDKNCLLIIPLPSGLSLSLLACSEQVLVPGGKDILLHAGQGKVVSFKILREISEGFFYQHLHLNALFLGDLGAQAKSNSINDTSDLNSGKMD